VLDQISQTTDNWFCVGVGDTHSTDTFADTPCICCQQWQITQSTKIKRRITQLEDRHAESISQIQHVVNRDNNKLWGSYRLRLSA